MHQQQRAWTRDLLKARGIDVAIFGHPHSVTWLTGFAPPVLTGPNLFAGAPPLVIYVEGRFVLVVVDALAAGAASFGQEADGELLTYLGYTVAQPLDGAGQLLALLERFSPLSGRTGIEQGGVPVSVAHRLLGSRDAGGDVRAIDGWLHPLRMVKTRGELALLRANFRLTDIGHAAAREAVTVGAREIDVWAAMEAAVQRAAGRRVPIGNDCVAGYRTENIGGWPEEYALRSADSIIVDLSVIADGYWSDSCATYVAGTPTRQQVEMHRVVSDALALGASRLRPGAVCADIDRAVRGSIAAAGYPVYPHHTGHGVGVSGHEAPRIVPYSDESLAPGMVIMLEPGIYFPGETGVRLEDAFLITEDGAERITGHRKEL
jgi:Xaa-Pro dipeptidase